MKFDDYWVKRYDFNNHEGLLIDWFLETKQNYLVTIVSLP